MQIPHLDTTNQDMLVRGWLLLLFTLVQGEHRKYPSAWLPWTQEEEKQDFIGGLTGVQDVKNSWWLAGWLASGHHTCTWVPRACLLIMHRWRSLLTISWHEWSGEQGGVPGSPDSLACSWAICSTSNRTICTSSVLVHWGKSVWWWRKSREAYFYRKTVPLRVQRCGFGQEERNMEELGLLEKTCRGVNLQEVITAESELQQYCCKQVWMPSFNWAWHFEPVTLWTDWIVMHVSINGRCAFSRSRFRMLGFFKCSLFRQCHVVWKISM